MIDFGKPFKQVLGQLVDGPLTYSPDIPRFVPVAHILNAEQTNPTIIVECAGTCHALPDDGIFEAWSGVCGIRETNRSAGPMGPKGREMILIVRRRGRRERGKIQQDMELAFRSLFTNSRSGASVSTGCWRPPVEVYEVEDRLVVTVEISGVREEDLNVEIDDSILRIAGSRPYPAVNQRRVYHQTGIPYGEFEAEVFLPFAIVLEDVEASYDNGILQVLLPRAQATRIVPKTIDDPATSQEE